MHEDNLGKNLKYLHPNIISNIDSYKKGYYYIFPSFTSVITEVETEPEKRLLMSNRNIFVLFRFKCFRGFGYRNK